MELTKEAAERSKIVNDNTMRLLKGAKIEWKEPVKTNKDLPGDDDLGSLRMVADCSPELMEKYFWPCFCDAAGFVKTTEGWKPLITSHYNIRWLQWAINNNYISINIPAPKEK